MGNLGRPGYGGTTGGVLWLAVLLAPLSKYLSILHNGAFQEEQAD
jgi:hypothetical protein